MKAIGSRNADLDMPLKKTAICYLITNDCVQYKNIQEVDHKRNKMKSSGQSRPACFGF